MVKDPSVGTRSLYEAGDQRNAPRGSHEKTYDEAPENAHLDTDSKDQRSIANRLAAAEKHNAQADKGSEAGRRDPTMAARMHGNEPSRGAKIDAELQRDDEEVLEKKQGKEPAGKRA